MLAGLSLFGRASASDWNSGDVVVGVGFGRYEVRDPSSGAVKDSLYDGLGESTGECVTDRNGNVYTTNMRYNYVVAFDLNHPHGIIANFPTTGENAIRDTSNESLAFDPCENFLFVGHNAGELHKYDSDIFLAEYQTENEISGTSSIDVASDESVFYTSEGRRIMRFDARSSTQLPDFALLPSDGGRAYSLKLLPPFDGSNGLLVADGFDIKRLDNNGNVIQLYDDPLIRNWWYSIGLDPDGTSFWTTTTDNSIGKYYRFDIGTGAQLGEFSTDTSQARGICIIGSSRNVECCGNGRVDSGEECDDGNLLQGDGCDQNCAVEIPSCDYTNSPQDVGYTLRLSKAPAGVDVNLRWQNIADAEWYNVHKDTLQNQIFDPVELFATSINSWTDMNAIGNLIMYKTTAENCFGRSGYSENPSY